ncbi:MAG: type II toxin-antitoxin system VapB family antitoxin [Phycisphaerae bacterium]|nr:type II toxin-antitoxin system VapB family antitoxin [Phycisphaerae bacterium]
MRTTIDIDETLLRQVMRILGTKSKSEAVNIALRRVVESRKCEEALQIANAIGWNDDLDGSGKAHPKRRPRS